MTDERKQAYEKAPETSGTSAPTAIPAYFVQVPPESTAEEINLIEMIRGLMRYKLMIISIVSASLALSVLIALTMQPVYRATVLMAPASDEDEQRSLSALSGQFGGFASLAGVRLSGDSDQDHALAVLKSRSFTGDFIANENLMPALFSNLWDSSSSDWLVEEIPTPADAYKLFNEKIRSVTVDDKTRLVTLEVEWNDGEQAASWANSLVTRLNDHMRARDVREAERSLAFLNEQLQRSSVIEIQQGIFRLIEHQIESIMLANAREDYAFRILDPAVAPDIDKFVRPKRRLIVMVALVVGGFLAIFIAIIRLSWADKKHA